MTSTLEQRVAALESGELERLRGLAQRRLGRLRQERAAVADLRERLDAARVEVSMAHGETARVRTRLFHAAEKLNDELEPLRVAVGSEPLGDRAETIGAAVDELHDLRGRVKVLKAQLEEANARLVAFGHDDNMERLRDSVIGTNVDDEADVVIEKAITELLDTRSRLKDALEELAEANAKLAKPTAPKPGDDSFNDDRLDVAMRELVQMAQKNRMPMSVWFSTAQERWCASDGQVWLYADSANNALMALWEHTK